MSVNRMNISPVADTCRSPPRRLDPRPQVSWNRHGRVASMSQEFDTVGKKYSRPGRKTTNVTWKSRDSLRSVKPHQPRLARVARLALVSLVALVASAHLIDRLA
jgi:hypothetical protein